MTLTDALAAALLSHETYHPDPDDEYGYDPCSAGCAAAILAGLTDSLDSAWAEAEAALPEGWAIDGVLRGDPGPWVAHIADDWRWAESHHDGYGSTPAAALRDLAAKLRAR